MEGSRGGGAGEDKDCVRRQQHPQAGAGPAKTGLSSNCGAKTKAGHFCIDKNKLFLHQVKFGLRDEVV